MSVINQMLIDLEKRHHHPVGNNSVLSGISARESVRKNNSGLGKWIFLSSALSVSLVLSYQWVSAKDGLLQSENAASESKTLLDAEINKTAQQLELVEEPPLSEVIEYVAEPVELASQEITSTDEAQVSTGAEIDLKHKQSEINHTEMINSDTAAVATSENQQPIELSNTSSVKSENTLPRSVEKVSIIRKELTSSEKAAMLLQSATALLRDNRLEAATVDLRKALSLDRKLHSARELLVGILLNSGRKQDAEDLLKIGISLDPANPVFSRYYGQLLVENNDLHKALQILKHAEKNAINDVDYTALLAVVSQRLSLHEEAVFYYMMALEVDGQRGVWWMGLAISLDFLKKSVEAVRAFQIARDSGQLTDELQSFVRSRIKELAV